MSELQPLKAALQELATAVHELCDPIQCTVLRDDLTATEHTGPSLLDQIAGVGHGGETGKSHGAPNRLPLDVAKLDVVMEIESGASDLYERAVIHTRFTPEQYIRRTAEMAQGWSDPQAVLWVADWLRVWKRSIVAVLEPVPRYSIAARCPMCQVRMVEVAEPGTRERVQVDALRVEWDTARDVPGRAMCQGCGASWEPNQFEFLGRLLGCEPVRPVETIQEAS